MPIFTCFGSSPRRFNSRNIDLQASTLSRVPGSMAKILLKESAYIGSYAKFDQVDLGKALSGRALPLFFPEKSVVTNFFQSISLFYCY